MNVVSSAISYIQRDMKWEVNHFEYSECEMGRWGRQELCWWGFAIYAQNTAGSGTSKPMLMSHIQREDLSLSNL